MSVATLDQVYRKFGEVSEAAQLLETELGTILLMMGIADANLIEVPDPQAAATLFKRINKQTLGQLLQRLHRSSDSAAHLEELLNSALAERNRLSHAFYRQHNFLRNSSEGCALMLKDLEGMHVTLLTAYKAVLLLSGIDLDKVVVEDLPTGHVRI